MKRTRRAPKPVTVERRKARAENRHQLHYEGPYGEAGWSHVEYLHGQPCALREAQPQHVGYCYGPIEAAHLTKRSRQPGRETWPRTAPLCRGHHQRFELDYGNDPERLKSETGIDLEAEAAHHAAITHREGSRLLELRRMHEGE